jgi:hypothetical protein
MEDELTKRDSVRVTDSGSQPDVRQALLWRRAELARELKALDGSIHDLQTEYSRRLEELRAQKKPLEDALHHVDALLRFEGHHVKPLPTAGDRCAPPVVPLRTLGSVTDIAVDLLEQRDEPMHFRDMAAVLQGRGVYIPGKDPAATLLSRMSRDSRFKRTKRRGVYALSVWPVRKPRFSRQRFRGMEEMVGSRSPTARAFVLSQLSERDIALIRQLLASAKGSAPYSWLTFVGGLSARSCN